MNLRLRDLQMGTVDRGQSAGDSRLEKAGSHHQMAQASEIHLQRNFQTSFWKFTLWQIKRDRYLLYGQQSKLNYVWTFLCAWERELACKVMP